MENERLLDYKTTILAAKLLSSIPQWWLHIIRLSKPLECTPPGVNPKMNYGLCVIMMCQCRFITGNKCTNVVGMLIMRKLGVQAIYSSPSVL